MEVASYSNQEETYKSRWSLASKDLSVLQLEAGCTPQQKHPATAVAAEQRASLQWMTELSMGDNSGQALGWTLGLQR